MGNIIRAEVSENNPYWIEPAMALSFRKVYKLFYEQTFI